MCQARHVRDMLKAKDRWEAGCLKIAAKNKNISAEAYGACSRLRESCYLWLPLNYILGIVSSTCKHIGKNGTVWNVVIMIIETISLIGDLGCSAETDIFIAIRVCVKYLGKLAKKLDHYHRVLLETTRVLLLASILVLGYELFEKETAIKDSASAIISDLDERREAGSLHYMKLLVMRLIGLRVDTNQTRNNDTYFANKQDQRHNNQVWFFYTSQLPLVCALSVVVSLVMEILDCFYASHKRTWIR